MSFSSRVDKSVKFYWSDAHKSSLLPYMSTFKAGVLCGSLEREGTTCRLRMQRYEFHFVSWENRGHLVAKNGEQKLTKLVAYVPERSSHSPQTRVPRVSGCDACAV